MGAFEDVQAVTFDVGGTLIEPQPSVGHVYAEVAARFDLNGAAPAELNRQFGVAWKAKENFDYSKEAWFGLVAKTFNRSVESLSQEFLNALYQRFEESDVWRVHDDVLPILDELASREINLGIISNWDERLRPLLKNLKLTSYFQAITVSSEVGFTKPSPVIFEQALRNLGTPADTVLHIGDNAVEDLEGARGAGLHALHLCRGGGSDILSLKEITRFLG